MRQDEGGPKLLNDYDPASHQYGGGLIYLVQTDTRQVLASGWYTGQPGVTREFGIGHVSRSTPFANGKGTLRHQTFAPFGDLPLVASKIQVESKDDLNISVIEVWGTAMYQQATCQASGEGCPPATRRAFQQQHYSTTYTSGKSGAVGYLAATTTSRNVSAEQPSNWDATPPQMFLAAVPQNQHGEHVTVLRSSWSCDAAEFYGKGGPASPEFNLTPCDRAGTAGGALILERTLVVEAGVPVELFNIFGYVTASMDADTLLAPLQNASAVSRAYATLGPTWKKNLMALDVPSHPALSREILWHGGYLRQVRVAADTLGILRFASCAEVHPNSPTLFTPTCFIILSG